jgi:hypothetical protein
LRRSYKDMAAKTPTVTTTNTRRAITNGIR